MPETVQINLRAGTEQKARWEDYVEESGRFASLSELIRASVEAEISQHDSTSDTPTPALANDIQQLQEELTTVRKHVAWLREQQQDAVDISDLAQQVFERLEPLPEVDEPIQVPEDVELDADAVRISYALGEERLDRALEGLGHALDDTPAGPA